VQKLSKKNGGKTTVKVQKLCKKWMWKREKQGGKNAKIIPKTTGKEQNTAI